MWPGKIKKGRGCLSNILGVKNAVLVLLSVFSLKGPQRELLWHFVEY